MEREYRFTVLMDAKDYDPAALGEDAILLQGVVDCWFETPDGIVVVDFKTDHVQTDEEVARHAELYRGQLAAYSLALSRVLGSRWCGRHCTSYRLEKPWKWLDFSKFSGIRRKIACNLSSNMIC